MPEKTAPSVLGRQASAAPPPPPARMAPAARPVKEAKSGLSSAFDPWNTSTTGHQQAESSGPRGWRDARTRKLQRQLRPSPPRAGQKITDAGAPGPEDGGKRLAACVPREKAREKAEVNVVEMLRRPGSIMSLLPPEPKQPPTNDDRSTRPAADGGGGVFAGLVVYINGSTHPLISDHKLKRVLAEQGAQVAIHLARRRVTHVIVGQPAACGQGSGGGLAGGKIEKEIARVRGCGVKFVGVEWVLESLKAGCRLPEARFACLKTASRRQRGVYDSLERRQAATDARGSAQNRP